MDPLIGSAVVDLFREASGLERVRVHAMRHRLSEAVAVPGLSTAIQSRAEPGSMGQFRRNFGSMYLGPYHYLSIEEANNDQFHRFLR